MSNYLTQEADGSNKKIMEVIIWMGPANCEFMLAHLTEVHFSDMMTCMDQVLVRKLFLTGTSHKVPPLRKNDLHGSGFSEKTSLRVECSALYLGEGSL